MYNKVKLTCTWANKTRRKQDIRFEEKSSKDILYNVQYINVIRLVRFLIGSIQNILYLLYWWYGTFSIRENRTKFCFSLAKQASKYWEAVPNSKNYNFARNFEYTVHWVQIYTCCTVCCILYCVQLCTKGNILKYIFVE